MLLRMRKAQSTLEYAFLITAAAGALLWMQNYIKRAVAGRLASSAHEISEDPYEPGLTQKFITVDIGHGTSVGSGSRGATIIEQTEQDINGHIITDVIDGSQFTSVETKIKPFGNPVNSRIQ